MEILSSLSMISHPLFKEISCVFPDGTLNRNRVEYFAERAYRNGATGMRIFPGFLVDIKLFGNVPLEQWYYNYLPWELDTENMKFDLRRVNEKYFSNLGEIARIINSKGMKIVFSMYDNCHWDNKDSVVPHSPWRFNINGVNSFYENNIYNDVYEDRVLNTFKEGKNVFMIEFCNEPKSQDQLIPFSKRLLDKFYKWNVRRDQLISGLEWLKGDQINPFYVGWRKKVDFWDKDDRDQGIPGGYRTLHRMHTLLNHKDVIDGQKHTSMFYASTDGGGIEKDELKKRLLEFFIASGKGPEKNKGKRWCYEALYFGYESDIDAVRGITEAVHQYYGFYPGRTPLPLDDLQDPGDSDEKTGPIDPEKPGPIDPEKPEPTLQEIVKRLEVLEERVEYLWNNR